MDDSRYYEKAGCLAEFLMILAMTVFLGLGVLAIFVCWYFQGVPM